MKNIKKASIFISGFLGAMFLSGFYCMGLRQNVFMKSIHVMGSYDNECNIVALDGECNPICQVSFGILGGIEAVGVGLIYENETGFKETLKALKNLSRIDNECYIQNFNEDPEVQKLEKKYSALQVIFENLQI